MIATFLLGAGASLRAGMPSVSDISTSVLTGAGSRGVFYRYSDGTYHSSESSETAHNAQVAAIHGLEPSDLTLFLEGVRQRVQIYFREYSKDREAIYEDIAYLLAQVSDAEAEEYENPALGPLIKELREGLVNNRFDLHKTSTEALVYIRWVVCELLSQPAQRLDHLPVVVEACQDQRIARINLITLNHDNLIEQVLSQNAITFTDGFQPEGGSNCRYWNPKLFQRRSPKARVLKLHGGVDWFRLRSGNEARQRTAIVTSERPLDRFGRQQTLLSQGPEILLGTFNKMLDYTGGPFADLFCLFRSTLSRVDALIASGYGFRDKGVNRVIVEWLKHSSKRKLLIIHPNFEQYSTKGRGAIRILFDTNRHQILGLRCWLEEARWSDVVDLMMFGS